MSTATENAGDYYLTTGDVRDRIGYTSEKTVLRHARKLGLGIALGGRAGHRYSDADVQALINHLRPTPVPAKRRKRRVA